MYYALCCHQHFQTSLVTTGLRDSPGTRLQKLYSSSLMCMHLQKGEQLARAQKLLPLASWIRNRSSQAYPREEHDVHISSLQKTIDSIYSCYRILIPFQLSYLNNRILTNALPPLRPSLLTPREMHNRNSKERVRRLQQTSQHIIPRNKRCDDAESATSSCQSHVREVIGCVARIEVCRSQANESQPDHEKQRAEGES
jgi:hypothetical protein